VLEITIPVFSIGLLGYLATRLGWFSAQAGEGLARFVFDFAIPALLLRTFANAGLPDGMPLDLIGGYYLPVAVFYLSGMLVARYFYARPFDGQVITGFSFTFGNAVFLSTALSLLSISVLLYLYQSGAFL
jgi:predicted permease